MPAVQVRREARLAVQRRASTPTSYNAETHTVDLVAATGTRVKRYSWASDTYYWEELAITPEAVDLGRVAAGKCPMLDSHSRWSVKDQLGVVEAARFENNQLILPSKFGDSEPCRSAEADVAAGTLSGVSIGYRISELTMTGMEDDIPIYLATRWELLEVSLCPVPADPAAGVRSEEDGLHPCSIITETRNMPDLTPAAEPANPQNRADPAPMPAPAPAAPAAAATAAPAADASAARMDGAAAIDFMEQARAFGEAVANQARAWVKDLTPEAARERLLAAAAEAQRTEAPLRPAQGAIRILTDERDTAREAVSNALLHRHNPKTELTDAGKQWRGMSLMEMARYNLEQNGEKVRGLSPREVADLAMRQHSTSDFPFVLANVANKTLRGAYEAAPQTFKVWQRRATARDFKQISRLQMGGAPSFLLVPEGGQFKQGTVAEGREVYSLATYGRIFSVTRQTLINDDVDAFTRLPAMFGRAAADFESDVAYAPLIANPSMGDGVALFHANHGNLAGSGAAVSETTVQAGETAMMSQVGLEGRPIRATPAYAISAVKDKVPWQKLLTAVTANATSGVNVYAGSMIPVVEPRLNRSAGATPWFMAADPDQVDTIEYAYLEGEDGVFLEERMGFEVDGLEMKARLDFASKAIDWRGMWMNPGT